MALPAKDMTDETMAVVMNWQHRISRHVEVRSLDDTFTCEVT